MQTVLRVSEFIQGAKGKQVYNILRYSEKHCDPLTYLFFFFLSSISFSVKGSFRHPLQREQVFLWDEAPVLGSRRYKWEKCVIAQPGREAWVKARVEEEETS